VFFALHRGVDDKALGEVVVSVAQALLRLGELELVARAGSDASTSPLRRDRLAQLAGRGGGAARAPGR
jgi:hypothetical protein